MEEVDLPDRSGPDAGERERAGEDPAGSSGAAEAPEGDAGSEAGEKPRGPVSGPRLVRLALLFYGALFAVAVLWRVGLAGEPILYASERAAQQGLDPIRDLAAGLVAAGAVILVSREITRRTRAGRELARALADALGPLTLRQSLVLALLSGVAEEAFFRGALQPRVGLVAASLLFGVVHFVPRRELLPWTAFSIAAGFLLGGLFEWTGNLLAPTAAHFAVNATNLPMVVRHYARRPDEGEP